MSSKNSTGKIGVKHISSIDGLRAIAVTAVVLYHLGISWIPGGFLGVDLFFVISGYVITRLILDSINQSSALDLRAFYAARLRRIYPGFLFMVICTIIFIGVWAPEAIKRFLSDLPYALTGSINWLLVARHQDYFETVGRPPLLQHTWSLAVELQFYLIWPIILLTVLKYFGKKNIARIALIIAMVSGTTLFFVSLQLDQANAQQISHIYFGTDTHSLGLFLGSALAVSWIPQNLSADIEKRAQDVIDGIGVVGLLGLISTFLFIEESNASLYRIAFPLAGIFGCLVIISLVHPASRFAPLISTAPFRWIGQRSYGIYIWHWVIFQVTRPSVDLSGQTWALYLARVLLVLALADISLRWVEIPFRQGLVQDWFRGMKYRSAKVQLRQKISVISSIIIVLAITSSISVQAINKSDEVANQILQQSTQEQQAQDDLGSTTGLWVTGDSVILGIRSKLEAKEHISLINARVGRQAPELLAVMRVDQSSVPSSPVVFNLGNNNALSEATVVEIFEIVKNQPQVIVVNTAVPRAWKDSNNEIISRVASRYSNVKVVDWDRISKGRPELFAPDGVHLSPSGSDVYVDLVVSVLVKTSA
ncbi:acyltransferase [Candidatus Nanopelagicus limnes]|jgi:peptidoglycan/LPS O-acetylase OafA/YrhL|uniref:Acyltransferase n=1 Tax=Candidatus Nanopelagicus limnae TaxID=1884634 RepID=A0A249JYV5_9ACTN|nr:acyltransferase family protein [Candidatus Nanopelagicus limnes]ASY09707.1 acyltransferase [Candidatus Nanopelagicus limnes]